MPSPIQSNPVQSTVQIPVAWGFLGPRLGGFKIWWGGDYQILGHLGPDMCEHVSPCVNLCELLCSGNSVTYVSSELAMVLILMQGSSLARVVRGVVFHWIFFPDLFLMLSPIEHHIHMHQNLVHPSNWFKSKYPE